jgi:hypothetical protein
VTPVFAGIATVAVAGGVLAVSARDPRATILGLLVVLLAAPFVASPVPALLPIVGRTAAALLAARLLVAALRGDLRSEGSRIGWLAVALTAAAASVAGFASHGLGAPPVGPAEAQAAAFGLLAIALGPLVISRDVLRIGASAILVLQAALLLGQAVAGSPNDGGQLVVAALVVAVAGAVAVVAAGARTAGTLLVADDAEGAIGARRGIDVDPARVPARSPVRPRSRPPVPAER